MKSASERIERLSRARLESEGFRVFQSGLPDFFIPAAGPSGSKVAVFLELKASGDFVRPHQWRVISALAGADEVLVGVVRSETEALDFLLGSELTPRPACEFLNGISVDDRGNFHVRTTVRGMVYKRTFPGYWSAVKWRESLKRWERGMRDYRLARLLESTSS